MRRVSGMCPRHVALFKKGDEVRIITHVNPDLDAFLSVCAVREFVPGAARAPLLLVPSNWDGADAKEDDIILDMYAGGKGMKGAIDPDGTVHSCFQAVMFQYADPESLLALEPLVKYVDAQDSNGSPFKVIAPELKFEGRGILGFAGLAGILHALKLEFRDDRKVLLRMGEIFRGMLKSGRSRFHAETEAERAEIFPGARVAISWNNRHSETNGVLFRGRGIRALVFVDGMNLGLLRHTSETVRMDHPAIRAVVTAAGEEVGSGPGKWYPHPSGFLFARGTRKAPALTPSRVNPRELANVAEQLIAR